MGLIWFIIKIADMVNSVKQISQFIGEKKKSVKQITWHHAAQWVNQLDRSLLGRQGGSGYRRHEGRGKRKDFLAPA